MNTISQIENALKSIDQATFQRLINHLLSLQGNKFVSAPGAVVGKEKTSKGTPDSFFCNNGKYLFVECTTQERLGKSKSFFEKLSKDIDHCFNETITTIKKEDIQKVVLACNEKIDVDEHKLLSEQVRSYNFEAEFEILNIQSLPLDIIEIPKLAGEYLNIEIVKGDIYRLEDFLLKTKKGIQPSLTNEFIGREEELRKCLDSLERVDIIFISGGQGIGKSKLAVKLLEQLSLTDYIPIVIQNSGVSLWDDYKHLFLPNKKYIILFDDANKSIHNLNYLLSKLNSKKSYDVKLVITARDYVKNEILFALQDYIYEEQNVSEFKDEIITKIVLQELLNVRNRNYISQKIVDLAKGNARVALMATYSITPESETNYLDNPVLLYEKYFKKISDELGIFSENIGLQAIAIVSFFGVLDRKNNELKSVLENIFNINWNELWTAIMNLHTNEILNVYSNEIVKVSDQVLATYAFYKCFLDNQSSKLSYSEWINTFSKTHSNRIRISLIDSNNTFSYNHIKELVLPHLNEVLKRTLSDDDLYAFYQLFWFYKGLDCLLYLRNWIESLNQNEIHESNTLNTLLNDYGTPTKYFDLLKDFWNHPNELLRPSLELTLQLLEKQPDRLPEIKKYLIDCFKYKCEDVTYKYLRQNILFDVLLDDNISQRQKLYADILFLDITEILLGWSFTEFGPSKGNAFTMRNFDLFKSEALMNLRKRMLDRINIIFDKENECIDKILNKIMFPGPKFDKEIYVEEIPLYQRIITDKLDINKYSHCNFVRVLAKKLKEHQISIPENWQYFTDSEIMKISRLLDMEGEYRKGKSAKEALNEKQRQFSEFVNENDWSSLEKFIMTVDVFFHQEEKKAWQITSSMTDIYISIAKKNKLEFENALKMFFNGKVSFNLDTRLIFTTLNNSIVTCDELLKLIDSCTFEGKTYWESVVLAMAPKEQITEELLTRLIVNIKRLDNATYIQEMSSYLKYEQTFDQYKIGKPELENYNIISYLTSIFLNKTQKSVTNFGFDFFTDCVSYFIDFPELFKEAYLSLSEIDQRFDYNGKQLKAVLSLDKNFLNDNLKNGRIGVGYSSTIRLENIKTNVLWEFEDYEFLIEDLLLTALDKDEFTFIIEEDIYSLFSPADLNKEGTERVKNLLLKLTKNHCTNERIVLMLIEVAYHNFEGWFTEFFREVLMTNKDFSIIPNINFSRTETWSGSKVPLIEQKIEFFQNIIDMIKTLPGILDYGEHIKFFEKEVEYQKKEIVQEQRNDFMEEYY